MGIEEIDTDPLFQVVIDNNQWWIISELQNKNQCDLVIMDPQGKTVLKELQVNFASGSNSKRLRTDGMATEVFILYNFELQVPKSPLRS